MIKRCVRLKLKTYCLVLFYSAAVSAQDKLAEVNIAKSNEYPSHAPLIGAYYYPWYGVNGNPTADDWRNVLRQKLVPSQVPRIGLYRSDSPKVIAEHVKQSRHAGLSFWAVSWWGPDTPTDQIFREAILKHPDADQLRYVVLYESTGRLGEFDKPHYDKLLEDFAYLEQHYFDDPSYLRINDRPVVLIYLSRVYFRDQGLAELAELRERFPEVYLVGDDVFGPRYRAEWAKNFDAVTAYDVYGQSTALEKASQAAITTLADNYINARRKANSVGTAFIPAIAPGYNDRATRDGHTGTARYMIDEPQQEEGSLFRAMIHDVALPNLDKSCGRLMMVTSFNEWYEDTQIEATAGMEPPTAIDSSPSNQHFTEGDRYFDYADLYLRILREETLE